MNTQAQLAQMQAWLDSHPETFPRTRTYADDLDEATLLRSFGGLSRTAQREQRRPVPVRVDEYGYDRRGTYYAAEDGRWAS